MMIANQLKYSFLSKLICQILFLVVCFKYVNTNIRFSTTSLIASKSSSRTALGMSGIDIPMVPAIIGTAVAVFAVFNIENPVDLTDRGRAEARAKRRAERIAKGETFNPKDKAGTGLYTY